MAPTIVQNASTPFETSSLKVKTATATRSPLKNSGSLNQFKHFDVTTAVGREFPDVQLSDLVNASNADTLLRDLAITGIPPPRQQANKSF
jgi:hypothetical protein